jgi:hypothetical protein
MNGPKKWRLVFDLAGLLGLAMLGLSVWFGYPQPPKWRVPLGPWGTFALGFSADSQKLYSIKDIITERNRIAKPILQRWETTTGILKAEYPLQVPAEDVAQIKVDPTSWQSLDYRVRLFRDNLLYVETRAGIRFFSVEDGRCITQQPIKGSWIWYLSQNGDDNHYCGIADRSNEKGAKAVLYDLNSGKLLHTFVNSAGYTLRESRLSSDRQHVLMLWWNRSQSPPTFEEEILQTDTWKCVGRFPSKEPGGYGLGPLLTPNLLLRTSYFKEDDLSKKRLECFRFDPENGTLTPDESHPFHGLVCREMIKVENDLLLRHGIRGARHPMVPQGTMPWWQKLWKATEDFVREGKLPEGSAQQDFLVYDFNTGWQLRQLTGLAAFGNQALQLSQDMRYVVGIEYIGEPNKPAQQTFLTVYEIPHHLWERTWNILFYVSIFMIFLWPVRLLRKRMPLEPRPIPTP